MKFLYVTVILICFSFAATLSAQEKSAELAIGIPLMNANVKFVTEGNEKIDLFLLDEDDEPVLLGVAPAVIPMTGQSTEVQLGKGFGRKKFQIVLDEKEQTWRLKKNSLGELILGIVLTAAGGLTCYVATLSGLSAGALSTYSGSNAAKNVLLYGNIGGGVAIIAGIVLMVDAPGSAVRIK